MATVERPTMTRHALALEPIRAGDFLMITRAEDGALVARPATHPYNAIAMHDAAEGEGCKALVHGS